ncbi:MAG: DUF1161 domain-containing protein [Betaproteobacteria bacterium]|nr:DUF1161 domain-containing protein [Betaproteobacteria bacterium]
MKKVLALCTTLFLAGPTLAADGPRLNCDDLKARIEAKFEKKGVKNYSLEAVDKKADEGGAKVLGTCDGNTKKMLYKRGAAPAADAPKDAKQEAKPAAKADAPKADAKPAPKAEPAKPAAK